jgi:phosphoglycolate phosphatase-like HAD superfamily hydrolase
MTIILDLDYTLLDTRRLKEALAAVFLKYGIKPDEFFSTYRQAKQDGSFLGGYNLDRHIVLLSKELVDNSEMVRQEVLKIISRSVEFLYPGAVDFLTELKTSGCYLILLTAGDKIWQSMKVENAGLNKIFAEIIYTSNDKATLLKRFTAAQSPIVVVNDDYTEMKAMREAVPSFFYFLKVDRQENSNDGFSRYRTFEELKIGIKKLLN